MLELLDQHLKQFVKLSLNFSLVIPPSLTFINVSSISSQIESNGCTSTKYPKVKFAHYNGIL
jgi:hypothetical protein